MKKLPPLLDTTNEGRRVYEFQATIKKRKVTEIHIDPHFEESHGSYMTDEMIYNFAGELEWGKRIKLEERKESGEYYSYLTGIDGRAYEMSWCGQDEANFLGVISCYRRSKYDKKHERNKRK